MSQTKMTDTQAPPEKEPSETNVARHPREASNTSISVSRGLWSMHFIYTLKKIKVRNVLISQLPFCSLMKPKECHHLV